MRTVLKAFRDEVLGALRDPGALLVLIGGVVLYAFFYPTPYRREVLKEVPVAVVDLDRTPLSRQLARMADAHELVRVTARPASLAEAERLVLAGEAGGIFAIPSGFERDVKRGAPATVGVFADATYFLVYRQVLTGLAEVAATLSAGIEIKRLEAQGMPEAKARAFRDPLPLVSRPLFNPAEGYATYVVPGVLILILQQTLLIGIGLRGAADLDALGNGPLLARAAASVAGRSLAFLLLYSVHALFYFGIVARLFGFPVRGGGLAAAALVVPFLLSTSFLGLSLSVLFRRREAAIQTLLFTSLPAVFLASYAWPPEALPGWLRVASQIIPSTSAIPALLRVNQMGASLAHVRPELTVLWGLAVVFFAAAVLAQAARSRRPD
ncbi:MAG: ABC transporter permease [Holophagales bacterium]|nr:ABC transporter permease [Holophagales bacterium]MBK9966055.1 ABC transporter permease [Holophagales bacterium]